MKFVKDSTVIYADSKITVITYKLKKNPIEKLVERVLNGKAQS